MNPAIESKLRAIAKLLSWKRTLGTWEWRAVQALWRQPRTAVLAKPDGGSGSPESPPEWDEEWKALFQEIVVDAGLAYQRLRRIRETVEEESQATDALHEIGPRLRRNQLRYLECTARVALESAVDGLRHFRPRAIPALVDEAKPCEDRLPIAIAEIKALLIEHRSATGALDGSGPAIG